MAEEPYQPGRRPGEDRRPAPASERTHTVAVEADIPAGARILREGNASAFVLLRVKPTEPPPFRRNFDPSLLRDRFRAALLPEARR